MYMGNIVCTSQTAVSVRVMKIFNFSQIVKNKGFTRKF